MGSTSEALPVAVVGGGLAGLTAAVELARRGRQVIVYEQASHLGGRARSRRVADYRFNMGPHALYAGGAAHRILTSYDVAFSGHRPPLKGSQALVEGQIDHLPVDPPSLLRARWLPWRAKFQVMGLFARMPRLDPTPWEGRTVDVWLRQTLGHAAARGLFLALLRLSTYSAEPGGLDAGEAIRQLKLGFDAGVLYLDGGWQTLVDGLEGQARLAGARFVDSCRVRSVRGNAEGWQLELGDGTLQGVSGIVLAVGPEGVMKILGDHLPASKTAQLRRLRPIDAACLDVALRRLPKPRQRFALGVDQPYYVSVHSTVADLAPEGGAMIHVMRYLDAEDTATRQETEQQLESWLDTLQPGWRTLLVDRQLMPRLRVSHGLYQVDAPRPGERLDTLPGIHLAGDWVGDEGWLADAAVASGQRAARQLLARSIAHNRAA